MVTTLDIDLEPSPWLPWCADNDHPATTYNPWLDATWCLCGARKVDGRAMGSSEACGVIAEANAWRRGQ